jgi:hypothetical protein
MKAVLHIGMFLCWFVVSTSASAGSGARASEFFQWRYQISAEERLRFEYKNNFDLNEGAKDNGDQLYHRFRLGVNARLVDEYLDPKMDIFIEGLDAQVGGYRIKANARQKDDLDLHQAFVKVFDILGSDLDIKLGRQELKYGKGRLIAAPTWANRIRSFDAGVLHYDRGGFYGDILYGQEVKYDDDRFNASRNEDMLAGAYVGYQKHKRAPLVEGYYLAMIDIKGTNDNHRYIVGVRCLATLAAGIALDIEVPYQFGQTGTTTAGTKDIRAYAVHADMSKSFDSAPWKPKVSVSYDQASGDKDPNDGASNTFIPAYQSTHDPYGLMDYFRWQNIRNPELRVTFSPTGKFRFTSQVDFFWLERKSDSWYNSSGSKVRTKTSGDRSAYVGSEISLRLYYDFTKNIKGEAGYAHFFPGGFVRDTGPDDDADWVYAQVSYKF